MLHTRNTHWFPLLLAVIAAVSLYDTFLIVYFSDTIFEMEQNPLGSWLLRLGHGEVGLFVRAKLAGTVTVVAILLAMHRCRSRKTMPVTTSLAAYQTGLFTYLTLA